MHRHPTLRGRYDRSVLSPLQWRVLAVIAYVALLGLQIDSLRNTSFRLELFGHEVVRVEHAPQRATLQESTARMETLPSILEVTPMDWPPPPIPTAWSPSHLEPVSAVY